MKLRPPSRVVFVAYLSLPHCFYASSVRFSYSSLLLEASSSVFFLLGFLKLSFLNVACFIDFVLLSDWKSHYYVSDHASRCYLVHYLATLVPCRTSYHNRNAVSYVTRTSIGRKLRFTHTEKFICKINGPLLSIHFVSIQSINT